MNEAARAQKDRTVAAAAHRGSDETTSRRYERVENERFRRFPDAELVVRDKVNLDLFWLKDDTLDNPDLLPPPDEIAAEIVENLEAASSVSAKSP